MCEFKTQKEILQQKDNRIQLAYPPVSPILQDCTEEPVRKKQVNYSSRSSHGKITSECIALALRRCAFQTNSIHCNFCQLHFNVCSYSVPLLHFFFSFPSFLFLKNSTDINQWPLMFFPPFFSSELQSENIIPNFQHLCVNWETKLLIAYFVPSQSMITNVTFAYQCK